MPTVRRRFTLGLGKRRAVVRIKLRVSRLPAEGPGAKRAPRRADRQGSPSARDETQLPNLIRAENLIWIFGYGRGRCGSTWLSEMLRDYRLTNVWVGPMIGLILGDSYYREELAGRQIAWERARSDFILGGGPELRSRPLRAYILEAATARFPHIAVVPEHARLVVHEVHGSIGAPLIMEALPESPMIVMVRDPRDALASQLAAERTGAWLHEAVRLPSGAERGVTREEEDAFIARCIDENVASFRRARQAFDAHTGPKALVKYEALRADPLAEMRVLLTKLRQPVDEDQLAQVVDKHLWDNVPDAQKGDTKFHRRATPGSYGEDLTPEQIRAVEKAFDQELAEFYDQRTP